MILSPPLSRAAARGTTSWSYQEAFARHRGLVSAAEQERLRRSRVAIAGLGGVGGAHLATLARLGIGSFHIADPDRFEAVNFNRQYGASIDTLGRRKATVMQRQALAINPDLDLRVLPEAITRNNVAAFLDGVNVLIDGIDFFALATRRLLFQEARRRGIWTVTAGPMGFSAAWLLFDPHAMSFDDYFDLNDNQERLEQLAAFVVGLTPRATHLNYLDLAQVDLRSEYGPSVGLACQLCASVTAAEVAKILLGRGPVRAAPHYCQFDPYWQLLRTGKLRWGNRHPWQRFKRWWLLRRLRQMDACAGRTVRETR
jgi:molybdopterin/thiamine biosynthesis adenylyltransferase